MASKTATEELEGMDLGPGGPGLRGPADPREGRGGGGGDALPVAPARLYVTGIWLALAAVLMFFMALTSSFIVRKGLSNDWVPFELPGLLWFNTGLLLVSSVTLEQARRSRRRNGRHSFGPWWTLTTALGVAFLAGQWVVWRELAAAGVYLASNPSSSFFYLLTATHGVHLAGGVTALFAIGWRHQRGGVSTAAVDATGIYWHFMDGLWVYLFLLLLLGR